MKKVVIFRNELLPQSETFIKEQARSLTAWNPVLAGYARSKEGLDLDGFPAIIIRGAAPKTIGWYVLKLRQCLGRPHPPTVAALRHARPALVHVHFGTDATDVWPSVRAARVPMVVTLHGYDINIHREWWEAGNGGFHRRFYPRRLLAMAKEPAVQFVAASHAIKRRAIDYGIPADKVTVCHIGVDTERFTHKGQPVGRRANRILFVGRMVEKKAPLLLISAYSEVRKHVPDCELVMIGDGPLLNDAKSLAKALNVPVEFHGSQDSAAVHAQLNLARVLCLPSITAANGDAEGFGLVILEAQASGVPVVTSALGGADEGVLDRHTGYTFEERDIHGLIQGLLYFVGPNDKIAEASAAAQRHVQASFDLRTCSNSLERVYSICASRHDASKEP